jgi:hypothetical protein
MFEYKDAGEILSKTKEGFAKTVDFQKSLVQSSIDLFNALTDKKFYTYSVMIPQSFNFMADNVKETVFKNFDYLQGHTFKS